MARADQVVVSAGAAAVVATWWWRGIDGPTWNLWVMAAATALYLLTTRDRGPRATSPDVRAAVLIPVKDNASTVGNVARASRAHGLPVYVIDDGSADGSGDRAREAGATVLVHTANRGKGAALLTGMRAAADAGHTHAICLDGDGQHDPADIPRFLEACHRAPGAIVAGVRDLRDAPGRSRFGRAFSNAWTFIETGWRVADTQCGFRAYPLAAVLALGLRGRRYDLEVEVLVRGIWSGIPVLDLPCRVHYPPAAERVSTFRPFVDNARISVLNTKLVLERALWPVRWLPRIRQEEIDSMLGGWSGRSRGTALGWRIVVAVLRALGRGPAHALAGGIAGWFSWFSVTDGVRAYASRIGTPISPARLYRNFAHALVDRVLFTLRGPAAFAYVHEGTEHMVAAFSTGGIVLGAHLGNLEVAAGGPGAEARMAKLHVVRFAAGGDHGRAVVEGLPVQWQPTPIDVNGTEGFAAMEVVRALRAGAVVAMHGDRPVDSRATLVEFLGAPIALPTGPYLLAALAQVPVTWAFCFRENGSYRVIAHPPRQYRFQRGRDRDAQLREWAVEFAAELERMARRYPEQWYNFHDPWASAQASREDGRGR